jgi:uncharacterized membrane-anchored protein YhcB (DUF1043 family)
VGAAFGGAQTIDWLLDPIREFAATAERDHYAGALVLALVVVISAGALMRIYFNQRAGRQKDKHELEVKQLELDKERLQAELDLMRRRAESASDSETLGKVPELLKLMFEQAGVSIAPQFQVLIKRFEESISEQKRGNDLSEANLRQRDVQQRELLNVNKAGFNDLGIRINDKLEEMVNKVGGMRDEVIQSLGEQINGMVEDLKQEISKLPEATAKSVEGILAEHQTKIDAQLQLILAEIRAGQTKPVEPTEPPDA